MSIATQIARVRAAREAIKTAIAGKGVTVPDGAVLEDLPALVTAIPQDGPSNKLCVVSPDTLTAYISYFVESYNSANIHNHDITFVKTSDSNGGGGFSTFRPIDVTGYTKLVITASSNSVRKSDVVRFIPHIGLTKSRATNLDVAYTTYVHLCPANTTSFEETTVELDISGYSGEYYLTYSGVSSIVITDFHLE